MNNKREKAPTKEEILDFLNEQIEIKSKQLELQKINRDMAVYRAEELKAFSIISQFTKPNEEEDDDDKNQK